MHQLHIILLLLISLFFASCDNDPRHIDTTNLPTHSPIVFAQGRYCTDYLKFECLPESRDPKILKGNEPLEDAKFVFYDWDEKKYNNLKRINNMEDKERKEKMEHYVLTEVDYVWMDKVTVKQWYKEMEVKMEEQYPGFWGDTPRTVKHRWMRLCVAKGNKYGYGLKHKVTFDKDGLILTNELVMDEKGNPIVVEGEREMQQWIELCGRIGLNFDRDPKWQYIVDFIKLPESVSMAYAGEAVEYIDFTVYGKNVSISGNPMTDWWLKDSLAYLPYPDRPVRAQGSLTQDENISDEEQ
jgi:hypothetical protein